MEKQCAAITGYGEQCSRWATSGLTGRFCFQHDPTKGHLTVEGLRRRVLRCPEGLIEEILELRWREEDLRVEVAELTLRSQQQENGR